MVNSGTSDGASAVGWWVWGAGGGGRMGPVLGGAAGVDCGGVPCVKVWGGRGARGGGLVRREGLMRFRPTLHHHHR